MQAQGSCGRTSRQPLGRARLAVFAGAAALLGIAGAAAWASIPDSSGVIHACYNSGTGALRVVDAGLSPIGKQPCPRGEKALSWNQRGSSAIAVNRVATGSLSTPGSPWTPIITFSNIPAGRYVAIAKTVVFDSGDGGGDCQLVSDPTSANQTMDRGSQTPFKPTGSNSGAIFNLEAVADWGAPTTIQLQCRRGGAQLTTWQATNSKIILVRLSSGTDSAVTS